MGLSGLVSDDIRRVGFTSIGIGIIWALQILASDDCCGAGPTLWLVGAAIFAGAGTGLLCASESAVNLQASQRLEGA